MILKVKQKPFGPVFVTFNGDDQLLYSFGETGKVTSYPPDDSPVDTLIASLGSCIVKSLQWAANSQKVSLNPFRVKVTATKSAELPGWIESAEIMIIGDVVNDKTMIPRLLKQAKAICTVSNSLKSEVNLSAVEN
jgi:uncharacterized OsmC-like protein